MEAGREGRGSQELEVCQRKQYPGPHNGKRRSPAAAARSRQRLLNFHGKLEPQLGPSRLQLELQLRNNVTPCFPYRNLRRVNLASKFAEPAEAEPCLSGIDHCGSFSKPGAQAAMESGLSQNLGNGQLQQEENRWRERYGVGVRSLSASGYSTSSSLRHLLTTPVASISFPTPPPPPDWLSRWSGDWWLVPAGMMTCCSSCRVWGPLTP